MRRQRQPAVKMDGQFSLIRCRDKRFARVNTIRLVWHCRAIGVRASMVRLIHQQTKIPIRALA